MNNSNMFESVEKALEFAGDRVVTIMPVNGGYLVTEEDDYVHYRQMQESIDPDCEKQYWYAVQTERSDGWDYGSYCLPDAVGMLKAEGNTNGLIAVIDEEIGSCVKEILYDEI